MKIVKKTQFAEHIFHAKINCLELRFLPDSDKLFGELFQEELLTYLKSCQEIKPEQLIINNLYGYYVIDIDNQKWMQTVIFPQLLEIGVKRKAYLFGEDIVAQLSIQQTAEEAKEQLFIYKYFSDYNKAIDWLTDY